MLLTQDGIRALEGFTINAAPAYDEDFNRVEGNDGLVLQCTAKHADGSIFRKQWPGHVAAPTLVFLVMAAQRHWSQAHQEAAVEKTATEVTA